jgi:hypothetical protein
MRRVFDFCVCLLQDEGLSQPSGVLEMRDGRILVADTGSNTIKVRQAVT